MTHDEYMALPPQTKYQIEKERRAPRVDAMSNAQLKAAKDALDEGKQERSGRRKK